MTFSLSRLGMTLSLSRHICQNLYLACEAADAGTCAIAAYDQELADSLIGVDGENEFVLYMAPVGKL